MNTENWILKKTIKKRLWKSLKLKCVEMNASYALGNVMLKILAILGWVLGIYTYLELVKLEKRVSILEAEVNSWNQPNKDSCYAKDGKCESY